MKIYLVIEERRTCVKQILDRIISFIYKGVLYSIVVAIILGVGVFFLYPHYQKYTYTKDCQQTGRSKEWCEKTWFELSELD